MFWTGSTDILEICGNHTSGDQRNFRESPTPSSTGSPEARPARRRSTTWRAGPKWAGSKWNRYLRCFRCYRQRADATTNSQIANPLTNPPTNFLCVPMHSCPKEYAPVLQGQLPNNFRRQWWCLLLRSRDGRGALHQTTSTGGYQYTWS